VELVLVERRLDRPHSFEELQQRENCASSCFRLHQVVPIRSYFSRDRTRLVCVYEAPDAEAVRRANRTANLPFDDVWSVDLFLPNQTEPAK
jgi:hypothetical protein